jgi:hypothetical protein
MNADKSKSSCLIRVSLCAAAAVSLFGCGNPNKANIELRKQNQALSEQLHHAKQEHDIDQARIRDLESSKPIVPTLPPERLEKIVTVYGIKLGRLTGEAEFDPTHPNKQGLKIYVSPVDRTGEAIKATGAFVVEAFDLAAPGGKQVGKWEYPVEQVQQYWVNFLTQTNYVLPAPWQDKPPANPDITIKVTFTDELTGRRFEAQKLVKLVLGGSAAGVASATQPAAP